MMIFDINRQLTIHLVMITTLLGGCLWAGRIGLGIILIIKLL